MARSIWISTGPGSDYKYIDIHLLMQYNCTLYNKNQIRVEGNKSETRQFLIEKFLFELVHPLCCLDNTRLKWIMPILLMHNVYTLLLNVPVVQSVIYALSYWDLFKKCSPQLLNIFLTFSITLSLFPAVLSGDVSLYLSLFHIY